MKKVVMTVFMVLAVSSISFGVEREVLLGVGIPHLLNAEYLIKGAYGIEMGVGAGFTYIPPIRQACGADVTFSAVNMEIIVRKNLLWAMSANVKFGHQNFSVHTVQSVNAPFYDSIIGLKGLYAAVSASADLSLGGVAVVPEFGVQFPVSYQRYETTTGPGSLDPSVRPTIEDGLNRINSALPFLAINFGASF